MKTIVVQMGARRRYNIPAFLYRQGYLDALYTDLCFPSYLKYFVWHRRVSLEIPFSKIRITPFSFIKAKYLSRNKPEKFFETQESLFSKSLINWGVREASVVYAMYQEGLPFLHYAKSQGLKIIVDVNSVPNLFRIEHEEQKKFSDWEALSQIDLEKTDERTSETIQLADALFCPSEKVKEELCQISTSAMNKVCLVKYACSIKNPVRNFPIAGRVLFVGLACLRKGIHYFSKAANLLLTQFPEINWDFRVSGKVSEQVRYHPETVRLRFLGHLSTKQVCDELSRADVFVLPTLAEGSSGAIFEALSSGIPIVTTPSAGSVIEDGREGYLVPEREVEPLAKKIYDIVHDRELRNALSLGALKCAEKYNQTTWEVWFKEALLRVNKI